MALIDLLRTMTKEEMDALARNCGTSVGMLRQVAYGHRRAGESLAINLERETGGKITCEQLRPDVDWAYIRGTGYRNGDAS